MESSVWRFIRLIACWAFTLGVSLVACLLGVIIGPSRSWLVCRLPWARVAARIAGIQIDLEGAQFLEGPAIFVSNHQSMVDVIYLPAVLPRKVRFVAKKELGRIPLWGWILRAGGGVMIDRKNARAALRSIRDGVRTMADDWSMLVFPEGTRSGGSQLLPFRRGAFYVALQSKLPMVPIGLEGGQHIVPPGSVLPRSGRVYVTVGAPIATDEWTLATLGDHVAEVRREVDTCRRRSVARSQSERQPTAAARAADLNPAA